jgi:hypothetical protein
LFLLPKNLPRETVYRFTVPVTSGGRILRPRGCTMLRAFRPWRCSVPNFLFNLIAAGAMAAIFAGLRPSPARSDTIMLRGGGQVEGKVLPDPKDKDKVQVWLLKGRRQGQRAR